MLPPDKLFLVASFRAACERAQEREAEAGVTNPYHGKPAKELARIIADAMAAGVNKELGKAVVRLLEKKRK